MPSFRYQTLAGADAAGGAAVIDAPDRATAVRELRRQGITPTKIETISDREAEKTREEASSSLHFETPRGGGVAAGTRRGRIGHMSRVEMATFIRELATAVQAGLPLVPALGTIARQIKQPRQRAIVDSLMHDVEHGRSLSDAAANVGKPFTDLTISLTRAGEASGRMGEILEQAANLLDRDLKMRRTLVGGLIYPAMLGILIAVAIGVLVGFIVPKILAPFAGKITSDQLPWPTRVVMLCGDFVKDYWWAIGIAAVAIVLLFQGFYKTPAGRLSVDRFLLKVPMLGKVLREVAVARFTRTLGTLVSAGLPALTALEVTRGTLGNRAMEQVIDKVCEQVSSGKTISEPMEKSGYFPSLLTQIIGLGERSGRLPQMLNQAANVFEDRTEASLKAFTAVFPVLMVLFAACIIGFVMAGVLLPLIQLQYMVAQ